MHPTMNLLQQFSKILHNQTARNGALFAVFSFFNRGLGFILLIIIAGFIDPEGYGHLNLYNLLVTLLSFFICLNSIGLISVNYFKKKYNDFRRTVTAVVFITIGCTVSLGILVFILNQQIEVWTGLSFNLQLLALLYCVLNVFSQINLEIWRIQEKVITYGIYTAALAILNFAITILFVVCLRDGWMGRIYAQILVALLFFVISFIFLLKYRFISSDTVPKKSDFVDCIKFGVPLIPHTLSFWIRQGLDRAIINNYQSMAWAGLFSFSFNFANIIQILGDAFNATNSVFIYKSLSSDSQENIIRRLRKQTVLIIIFFAIVTFLVCIASRILIPIVFPEYKDATVFLLWQCLGAFFQCVYAQFVNFLFYYKKTNVLMSITISISLLHALLSVLLTRYSIMYTAYIGAFSSFLIMVCVFLYSRKLYKLF